jgi:hypothetical protein
MRNQNETEHPTTGDPAVGSRDLLCCVALKCAEAVQYESGPTLNAEHIKLVLEKYLPRWVDKYYVPKRSGWHYTRNLDGFHLRSLLRRQQTKLVGKQRHIRMDAQRLIHRMATGARRVREPSSITQSAATGSRFADAIGYDAMINKYSKYRRNAWTTVVLLRGRDTEIISAATSNFRSAVKQVSEPVVRVGGRVDKRRVKIVAVCQGGHEKFFDKKLWAAKPKHHNNH